MYIYALVDPVTDDIRYVGKAVDPCMRLKQHLYLAQKRGETHVQAWLGTLEESPWIWLLEQVDEDSWMEAERHWIAALREDGEPLTNLTDGGEGSCGRSVGEHERTIKSELAKEQWADDEMSKKMCAGMRGPRPQCKGKSLPEEHKRKISEGLRRAYAEGRR